MKSAVVATNLWTLKKLLDKCLGNTFRYKSCGISSFSNQENRSYLCRDVHQWVKIDCPVELSWVELSWCYLHEQILDQTAATVWMELLVLFCRSSWSDDIPSSRSINCSLIDVWNSFIRVLTSIWLFAELLMFQTDN